MQLWETFQLENIISFHYFFESLQRHAHAPVVSVYQISNKSSDENKITKFKCFPSLSWFMSLQAAILIIQS